MNRRIDLTPARLYTFEGAAKVVKALRIAEGEDAWTYEMKLVGKRTDSHAWEVHAFDEAGVLAGKF